MSTERVAGATLGDGAAGHEAALLGDDVHVLGVGADVAGGVVAAVQRLHEAAVGAQQRLGLVGERVADDDRLAAAEVEPGERGLVGHPAGEVEHVAQGVGVAAVGVEAGAAEGRAERGGVDRDDARRAAALVVSRRRPARARRGRRTSGSVLWGHGGGPFWIFVALGVIARVWSSWQGWTWTGLDYIRPFYGRFQESGHIRFRGLTSPVAHFWKSKELRVTASLKGERRGNATDRNRITPHAR